MGETPFPEIFREALKASSLRAATLAFGMFVAIGMASEQIVLQAFLAPDEGSIAATLRGYWPGHEWSLLAAMATILLVHVFGRANLIAVLASHRKKSSFAAADMVRRFTRALAVDAVSAAALFGLAIVFALPSLMAFLNNRGAFEGVMTLSVFAFIPVLLTVSFVRHYGTFYYLLSPLRFRSSIDRGATLFSRFMLRSLAFWVFLFVISAAFTFLLKIAMLGTSVLLQAAGLQSVSDQAGLLVGAAGFIWFAVLDQALILRFFEDIASGKDKEKPAAEERVLDPSMPPAA